MYDPVILYSAGSFFQQLKLKTEDNFKRIMEWFQFNKITLNVDKTEYLTFISYTNDLPNTGTVVMSTDTYIPNSIKYLGLVINR